MKNVIITSNFPEASLGNWKNNQDCIDLFLLKECTSQLIPSFCFKVARLDTGNYFCFRFHEKSKVTYPNFYERFSLFVSIDLKNWKKISFSRKINKEEDYLEIEFNLENKEFYISSYPPYFFSDIDKIIHQFSQLGNVSISQSDCYGGKEFFCEIERSDLTPKVLIVCGQHPGESISLFFLEGVLNCLINKIKIDDSFKIGIIVCFWVPGLIKSHRYTNGFDLNRSWKNPKSQLQKVIQDLINNRSIQIVIDVHGDEISRTNYIESYLFQKEKFQSILKPFPRVKSSVIKNFIKRLFFGIKTERGTSLTSFSQSKGIDSILVELSMVTTTPEEAYGFGQRLISEIYNSF